jgi:hypothetical protein
MVSSTVSARDESRRAFSSGPADSTLAGRGRPALHLRLLYN